MIKQPTVPSELQPRFKRIQKVSNGLNKVIKRLDIEHKQLFNELDAYHKQILIKLSYTLHEKEREAYDAKHHEHGHEEVSKV